MEAFSKKLKTGSKSSSIMLTLDTLESKVTPLEDAQKKQKKQAAHEKFCRKWSQKISKIITLHRCLLRMCTRIRPHVRFNCLLALLCSLKNAAMKNLNQLHHGLCHALMNTDVDSDCMKVINYHSSSSYTDLVCKSNYSYDTFD